jgi:hypothetical protein
MTASIKTTVVFLKPFQLPSFSETLPPGEYDVETQLLEPVDWIEPGTWTSSVLVHLHPRSTHPGLSRTLSVPLADLEHAVARDKLSGKALTDYFLEEMLADPMIRLVMQADGVDESELRSLYSSRPVGWREDPRDRRGPGGSHDRHPAMDAGLFTEGTRPGTGE